MKSNNSNSTIFLEEVDKKIFFEQYKLIVESLNNINQVRESANSFWIGINAALIGAVAYVRDAEGLGRNDKPYLAYTLIFFGIALSFAWINYLLTIKKSVDIRNAMLIDLEKNLPVKFITQALNKIKKKAGGSSLSYKEMLVPILFVLGYLFFAIMLHFYPRLLCSTISSA